MFGVNILIVATIGLVMNLLGIGHYVTAQGIDYQALLAFCFLWGMGGSFISLMLSKWMAKRMMGVEILSATGPQGDLVRMVHALARKAGLREMPEVGLFHSPEANAFATGPSRNNSLVAVSTGLLQAMDRDQVEAVLGHEISHIANGDMVTMTLLQGVVNAFVMFFARIVAFAINNALRSNNDKGEGLGPFAYMLTVWLFDILFGIVGSMVVFAFSRYREFRADSGGAKLAGKEKMISALEALQRNFDSLSTQRNSMQTMQISARGGLLGLFMSHPPLAKRIQALKNA